MTETSATAGTPDLATGAGTPDMAAGASTPDVAAVAGAVWKQEAARIVGGLLRMVHDVGLAEEFAQDALVVALQRWPVDGVPDNPGAWLMTIAKRRAVDHLRRTTRLEPLTHGPEQAPEPADDDVLRLMFTACHPVLQPEARVALTLRVVAGLSTTEIARAFLVTEPVIVRRIAGAKRTLADAGVAYEPSAPLASVLEVVYLIFNEGYSATSGDDLIRADLCLEALRLGRLLAGLAPDQPEAHGLVALMEIQQSRSAARTGPSGEPVQLHEQNRGRWDQLLIRRGFAAMLRAREARETREAREAREAGELARPSGGPPPQAGPYVLQAAIAVCHAQARTAEDTDWARIASLYDALVRLMPTPVVRLNRAVAVGFARGPQAGLDLIDELRADPRLTDYHLLPSVRGDLLRRLGRVTEARHELERAAGLTANTAEREFLLARAALLPEVGGRSLGEATAAFLASPGVNSPATARAYGQTLSRIARVLGERTPLSELTAARVHEACQVLWADAMPRGWNRHVAALRSFATWANVPEISGMLQPLVVTSPPAAGTTTWPESAPLRERTLWTMVRESSAPITAILALDIEDLDLDDRRTITGVVSWRSATARLLTELIAERTHGPVFLSERRPGPGRPAATRDLCPVTGRRRLSYERAEYLCKQATGSTLRRLRP
ncbi:DUF6596 domain-containing protein [Actinoplanes sp. CA-015351]|uniref:RNA polymerase sigma factor n=1 Tax=Actinoplanes sp. CA-015351 TaxID=3239897 RepID=UPI003D976DFC